MKLSESQRNFAFLKARSINVELGAMFQNPMDITQQDLDMELRNLEEVKLRYANLFKSYEKDLEYIQKAINDERANP